MSETQDWNDLPGGHQLPAGYEPLAMLYAGHQFENYIPQPGNGRAVLPGEARNYPGEKKLRENE